MRIAYIVPSLDNKGPIIVVNNLVRFLKDKVDQIDVYYLDSIEGDTLDFDCPTYKIKMNEKIAFDQYDIIHSHCLRPDIYINKWQKYICKSRTVSTLHQDTFKSLTYQYNKLLAFVVTKYWLHIQKKFTGITAISQQLKDQYDSSLNNKVRLIYNGCFVLDKDRVELDNLILSKLDQVKSNGYKILLSYAYITKRKGLKQVIDILPLLTDFVLFLIGDGSEIIHLKDQVKNLGLEERVYFFPAQRAPYLYLQNVDIFIIPSYSEGFGLAMVEAALQKKSIVCSNIPSFNEIFTKNEATFFELDNLESLKEAIKIAYENKDLKSKNAFFKAKYKFTADIMADNFLNYYKSL